MYTIDSVNVEIKSLSPRVYHGEMKVVGDEEICYVYGQYEKTARGTEKTAFGLYDKSCMDYFDTPGRKKAAPVDDELKALLNMLGDEDPPRVLNFENYTSPDEFNLSSYQAAFRRLYNLMDILTPDHSVKAGSQNVHLHLNSARGEIRHLAADYDSHHSAAQSYDAEAEYVDDFGGRLYLFISRIVPEDRKEYDRIFFRISRGSMLEFLSRQTREDTVLRREQYYKGHFGAPEAVVAADAAPLEGKTPEVIPQCVEGENDYVRLIDAPTLQDVENLLLNSMLEYYEENGMKIGTRSGQYKPFEEELLDSFLEGIQEGMETVKAAAAPAPAPALAPEMPKLFLPEDEPEKEPEPAPEPEKGPAPAPAPAPAPEPEKAPAPEPAANPAKTHPFGSRDFYELFGLTVKVPEDGLGHYEAEMSVRSDKGEPLYVYLSTAFEGNTEAIEDAEADRNFFGAVNRDSYLDEETEPGDALEEYNSFTGCLASEYDYSFVLLGRALQAVTTLMPELITSEAAGIIRQLRIERVPLLPAGDEADPDACMDTLDAEVEIQKLDGERIFVYSSRSDTGKEEKQYFRVSKESWFDFIRMPLITFGPGFDPKTGRVAMPALVNGEEYTSDTEAEASAFARVYTLEDLFSAWVDLPVFYHQLKDETGAFKEAFI